MSNLALVIGAGSTIATALVEQLQRNSDIDLIVTSSRNKIGYKHNKILKWQCDNSETQIAHCLSQLPEGVIKYVFICNGVLHQDGEDEQQIKPEKRLEDINPWQLTQVFNANTLTPLLWLKHLIKYLPTTTPSTITVFSARVGSIADNRLGGWYSYRASKAALNMLVKTAAIEYGRRNKQVKLLAFHPGTTDTPLSQPFQQNLGDKPLFTPQFVAEQLFKLLPNYPANGQASFIDWQGKDIKW